jgi:AcrR family transcriptional regulator
LATKKVSIVLQPIMEPKERILAKAHELFHRYGIRSVSMDDIAAQTGMSKKTLYHYYVDKEELVSAVFTSSLEEKKGECLLDQQEADNALHEVFLAFDRVREMFSTMNPSVLFDLEKYHAPTFTKFKAFQNDFLYVLIRANLERGIAEGLYRPEIDIDTLTRYRIHSTMLSFSQDVFPSNRTNIVHIEQQLFEHFLYGLATPKGDKLIEKYKKQRIKK